MNANTVSLDCDACGEVKTAEGGEFTQGMIHPAMIDPPERSWVCADCLVMFEEQEVDRAEEKIENQYLEGEYR